MKELNDQINALESEFSVTILVAKITGKRWAFKDRTTKDVPVAAAHKILLNSTIGAVVYKWYDIAVQKQIELEKKLIELGAKFQWDH